MDSSLKMMKFVLKMMHVSLQVAGYRGQNANMHMTEAMLCAFESTDDHKYLDRARSLSHRICVGLASQGIQNHESCIENDGFCTTNDEISIYNDGFCIKTQPQITLCTSTLPRHGRSTTTLTWMISRISSGKKIYQAPACIYTDCCRIVVWLFC